LSILSIINILSLAITELAILSSSNGNSGDSIKGLLMSSMNPKTFLSLYSSSELALGSLIEEV
jgi:hypothetical protein